MPYLNRARRFKAGLADIKGAYALQLESLQHALLGSGALTACQGPQGGPPAHSVHSWAARPPGAEAQPASAQAILATAQLPTYELAD